MSRMGASPIAFMRATSDPAMGPSQDGNPVRFRVRIDGRPPDGDHGADVDEQMPPKRARTCTSPIGSSPAWLAHPPTASG